MRIVCARRDSQMVMSLSVTLFSEVVIWLRTRQTSARIADDFKSDRIIVGLDLIMIDTDKPLDKVNQKRVLLDLNFTKNFTPTEYLDHTDYLRLFFSQSSLSKTQQLIAQFYCNKLSYWTLL